MKLKLDENLSRRAADLIRAAGHDAATVFSQGVRGAADETLFDVCGRESRALVNWIAILAKCFAIRPLPPPA